MILPSGIVGNGVYGNLVATRLNLQIGPVPVTVRACSVSVPHQVVSLPTRDVTSFTGGNLGPVGGVAGETPFTPQLNCDPNLQVTFRLDGTVASGTTSANGVFANATGGGHATGVGVQVLRAGHPVPIGTNQSYGATGGGVVAIGIPFTARYYKTASTIGPGSVTAVATLT